VIGFRSRNIKIRRKDEVAYVHVQRFEGSDGDISCILNTRVEHALLGGRKRGQENVDFEPIEDLKVDFKH